MEQQRYNDQGFPIASNERRQEGSRHDRGTADASSSALDGDARRHSHDRDEYADKYARDSRREHGDYSRSLRREEHHHHSTDVDRSDRERMRRREASRERHRDHSKERSRHSSHRSRHYRDESPRRHGGREESPRRHAGRDDYDRHASRRQRPSDSYEEHHRARKRPDYDDSAILVLPLDEWPRKLKNWDVPPQGFDGMTADQVKATGLFIPASAQPKVTNLTPFVDPQRLNPQPSMSSAQTVHAKRVILAGLPPNLESAAIDNYFSNLLRSYGFAGASKAAVIQDVKLLPEEQAPGTTSAMIECVSDELANALLSFDGHVFDRSGYVCKFSRPREFNNQEMFYRNADAAAPGAISNQVADSPSKIFIGGIPFALSEPDIIEILQSFGPLKAFHLVRDASGQSKGYAFCEYVEPLITDTACAGLNQFEILDKRLVVQRASVGSNKPFGTSSMMAGSAGIQANVSSYTSATSALLPTLTRGMAPQPSTVLQLINLVTPEELFTISDDELKDLEQDVLNECQKYGNVKSMFVPIPLSRVTLMTNAPPAMMMMNDKSNIREDPMMKKYHPTESCELAVGRVFVEFESKGQAATAVDTLAGRKFGDNLVLTAYYSLDLFQRREFN